MAPEVPAWKVRLEDPAAPLYPVSVVADLLEVDVQVVRRYDVAGITSAERSEGNQRRYSREDIAALAHALGLAEEGMSKQAIARILALEQEVAALRAQADASGERGRRGG